jgi:predicted oxidoreductase
VVWCAEPSYGLHGVDRVRPQKAVVTRKAPRYLVAYKIPIFTPEELEGFERAARLAGADGVPFESLDSGGAQAGHGGFGQAHEGARDAPL